MQFSKWHGATVKKVSVVTENLLYLRTFFFGCGVFLLCWWYTTWLDIPGAVNKSTADTASILVGLSMLLTSLCYFWDFVDTKIIYRKHLGIVGFAFATAHLVLSWDALESALDTASWQNGAPWAVLTALGATLIFTIMAAISNRYLATQLGGRLWRSILRTGYIALILVLAHVVLLKSQRWITWFENGMQTPPSLSLLTSIFLTTVIILRIALAFSLMRSSQRTQLLKNNSPSKNNDSNRNQRSSNATRERNQRKK